MGELYINIKSKGKLKDLKNIDPLIKMLNDYDNKIRLSAVKALGNIGNNEAIEPLIQKLGDDDWNVKKQVEKSLHKIDPNWMNYL